MRDLPVGDAAEKAGEIVGTLAMETILAKGVSTAGKVTLEGLEALKGTKFAAQITELAQATKTAIAETKIPTKLAVVQEAEVFGDTGLPKIVGTEHKTLGEVFQNLEARAQQVLSGGKKAEELSGALTGSFFGKTEQQVLRSAPKEWKKVPVERGNGWKLLDKNGVERIRFMRPVKETTTKWERMKVGYWVRKNADNEFLDEAGKVIPSMLSDDEKLFQSHITYTGVRR